MNPSDSSILTHRRGSVLLLAMAVLVVLASLALVFGRSMRVESGASANYVAGLQAQAVAQAALEYVKFAVDGSNGELPADDQVNAEAVPVAGGYFWLLKPDPLDDAHYAFGIIDEAGKLNLNTADVEMIARLPNMTIDLAAGVVDWRDPDDDVQSGGAESQYYLMLPQPYYAKNDRFETVEELLLVKDMTPLILYGEDANRNGILDTQEDDGDLSDPPDNRDGWLDRGMAPFVTVYSAQSNLDAQGQTRINVNTAGTSQWASLLNGVVDQAQMGSIIRRIRSSRPYPNLVQFYYRSSLTLAEFEQIQDRISTSSGRTVEGLVNVRTAPREVLLCLPTLDESDVQAIINARGDAGAGLTKWTDLIQMLSQEKAVAIGSRITMKSYRCSVDIVAVDGTGRSFKRYQAVLDAMTSPPKVLYWRDLSSLGWPLDPQILEDLQAGRSIQAYGVQASVRTQTKTGGR